MKREMSWPLGIVLFFLIFAGSLIGFAIWSGINHPVQLVDKNYYEKEIGYQEEIDSVERGLKHPPELHFDSKKKSLHIRLPKPKTSTKQEGVVRLYRPSRSSWDIEHPLQPDGTGAQEIDLSSLQPGLWRVWLRWNEGEDDYAWKKDIVR